jgi:hypothetical protein
MSRIFALFVSFALVACTPKAPDATPEGAVRLYLDRMDATTEGSATMREVYALLGPATRKNLEERASRAGKIQGRRIEPFEMLAAGRFALKFRPKAMSSRVTGDTAVVDVVGYDAQEVAQVNVVREGAAYKVELDLPEVAVRSW